MRRIVLTLSLLAFGLTLSACESSKDPSEWFDSKKPLPGERKDVFPDGVPGVPQGVPPELLQGYEPPAEPVPEPRVVEEKPKPKPKSKPKPKPKTQAAGPRTMLSVAPPSQQQQQQQAPAQSAFPDPPRR